MKNLMSILPVVAITLASTADANAQAPVKPAVKVQAVEKAKVSEAAKVKVQQKIIKPGAAAGAFVEENGPTFAEWSAKQKGAEKRIDPVITPAIQKANVQKAAAKIKVQ